MVSGSNHQDSIVVLKAVNFVEEVTLVAGANKGVDIFKYQKTRRISSGFLEDGTDGIDVGNRFDVEQGDWSLTCGKLVHQGTE